MKVSTRIRLGLGFGVQVLLTAVLGIGVLFGMDKVQSQFQVVAQHDAKVIANARHLSKLIVDMETGQRGFVITAKEEFLEPYHAGAQEFNVLINREQELIGDDPSQVAVLERINRLVQEWKEVAAEPEIAMARKIATNTSDAALLQAVLGRGRGCRAADPEGRQ